MIAFHHTSHSLALAMHVENLGKRSAAEMNGDSDDAVGRSSSGEAMVRQSKKIARLNRTVQSICLFVWMRTMFLAYSMFVRK